MIFSRIGPAPTNKNSDVQSYTTRLVRLELLSSPPSSLSSSLSRVLASDFLDFLCTSRHTRQRYDKEKVEWAGSICVFCLTRIKIYVNDWHCLTIVFMNWYVFLDMKLMLPGWSAHHVWSEIGA